MRVTLAIRKGPMLGRHRELELGPDPSSRLVIGRDPGPGGWLLEGDSTVSRRHGELFVQGGRLVYENASSNGTQVDGSTVLGRCALQPGAVLAIGGHEIEVRFRSKHKRADSEGGSLWNAGPLANPGVRLALIAYLVALLALAVFLGVRGPGSGSADFLKAYSAYEERYLPSLSLGGDDQQKRLERATRLSAELEAHVQAERWNLADGTCRQLMALDQDPDSPIYRFAAERLGDVNERRR